MSEYKSDFLRTLSARGYIKQTTHVAELDAYCSTGVPTAYIGIDPTAAASGQRSRIMRLIAARSSGDRLPRARWTSSTKRRAGRSRSRLSCPSLIE